MPDRSASATPLYVDLLPPCNAGCPAGENIQAWLAHAKAGDHEKAWRQLVADNPFAAIHGRVCYHPCESVCNRAHVDSSVSIHSVERALGDMARQQRWTFAPPAQASGKRVLVVGSGPSGLSAAYHLAQLGHQVEIRDAGPEPGGMMRYGIPAYRLPRDVLDDEIDRIRQLGVRMVANHRVEDLMAEEADGSFDAVFVAVGAHLSKRIDIPAMDAARVVDAVSFLRGVASGERPVLGQRVAIYGGGNTAMDAARVARRLGAEEPVIVYRRTREQMPAHEEEAADAEREGVRINWLRTITAFESPELMTIEVMELDETGFPRGTGRLETLAADTLILALGQDTDTGFLRNVPGVEFARDGTLQVSSSLRTGCPGVFAGGDMVPSERTVTVGVGHGKKAARHIDAYLRETDHEREPKHREAAFDELHLIERSAEAVDIPLIASINGSTPGGWVEYAHAMQEAGASGIELNIYYVPGDGHVAGRDVEQRHVDIVARVKGAVSVPVAVKLSPQFSSPGEMALRLDQAGADALVLFNRFLQPDIDVDTLGVTPTIDLSSPVEARLPRTWIALLRGRVRAALAATTGVETSDDVVKYLLAGADVVMTASALLRHGPAYAATLLDGLTDWMTRKGYTSIGQLRGLLAVPAEADQAAYERAGYVAALQEGQRTYSHW